MEKFTVSSETLREKIEEIESLKKKLKQYETPTVICTSEEWENKKIKAYKMIEEGISIIDYEWWPVSFAVWKTGDTIWSSVRKSLNYLTDNKNPEWSERISFNIKFSIESLLIAFPENFFQECALSSEKMHKIIYNSIIYQLDDGNYPCILEDVHVSK
tara:strand:+ start:2807 stop:3280 length:474 start_codon:yes stop_codon:yes gene_type:complete